MWELDHNEGWVLRNWYFFIVVLGKTLESPLDCKEIKLGNPKGHQPWIFIRRTDAEAEVPVLSALATWCKELTHCKRPWCWERLKVGGEGNDKGRNGWMASLNGHEFEQSPGHGEWQGNLACCSPWGHKESDMTEHLNNNNNNNNNNNIYSQLYPNKTGGKN